MIANVQGVVDKQSTKPTGIPFHMEFNFLWDKTENKENKSKGKAKSWLVINALEENETRKENRKCRYECKRFCNIK